MTSNELEIFKQSILDDVRVMMQTTGQVTQYIGARYVPLLSEPLDWSNQKEYEPLTIVTYQGNSYTSRQFVPKGVPITNGKFWASTGNFNAQIEQYRKEVAALNKQITNNTNTINSAVKKILDLTGKKAVFLGDSLTECHNQGEITRPWPTQFGNITGAEITNLAIGGSTAADISIAPSTAWKQANKVTPGYDYCFFMFGTNDYGYGSAAPLGKIGTTEKNTVRGGLSESIKFLQKNYPFLKIIGIIPPYMPGDTVVKDGRTALTVKATIVEVYCSLNVPYIDLTHGLGYNAENWDAHLAEWDKNLTRLHPTQEIYDEMAYYIAHALSVNSFGLWYSDFVKEGSNLGVTPESGTTVLGNEKPPICVVDHETHNVYIDFGDGFKTDASNEKVFKLPVKNIYRDFYFPIAAFNPSNVSDTKILIGAVTRDTGEGSYIQIIGPSTIQNGLNMYGCITIPFYYF